MNICWRFHVTVPGETQTLKVWKYAEWPVEMPPPFQGMEISPEADFVTCIADRVTYVPWAKEGQILVDLTLPPLSPEINWQETHRLLVKRQWLLEYKKIEPENMKFPFGFTMPPVTSSDQDV